MKATAFEFRIRFWIFLIFYTLGFWAPWDAKLHLDGDGPNAHVWGQLAVLLSRHGAISHGTMSISAAFNVVLVAGILCALAGAMLRTWGSACLGADVTRNTQMHGDTVIADGPYRHLRNPLHVGMLFNTLALALLMPASGAIFTIVLVTAFQLRLILGEEAFLTAKLGAPYTAYCEQVPRLWPALHGPPRAKVAASGERPKWPQAFLAEIYMWGVAVSFATLGWRYDAHLLIQCVLVSLGAAMVVRGLTLPSKPNPDPAA